MFCAPTATFEPLHAAVTVGSSTGEGNSAISSRVWPATSGKKASTKALASAGFLYIFQLAAISDLRDIFLWFLDLILVHAFVTQSDGEHNADATAIMCDDCVYPREPETCTPKISSGTSPARKAARCSGSPRSILN